MDEKIIRSVVNPDTFIKVSAEVRKAKELYLDPLSFHYRKQLKALLKAGYEVVEPFNHVHYKGIKDKKTGRTIYNTYNGAIKLKLKE